MHCKLLEKNHNPVLDTVTVARNPFSSRSWHSGLRKPTSRWKLSLSPLSTSLAGALASQFEKISKIQKEKKRHAKNRAIRKHPRVRTLDHLGGLGLLPGASLEVWAPILLLCGRAASRASRHNRAVEKLDAFQSGPARGRRSCVDGVSLRW